MPFVKQFKQVEGRRRYSLHGPAVCSKCLSAVPPKGRRYCNPCHAAWMREWRKAHPLTEEQRKKDNCRSYANAYKKRGKLVQVPCEKCGSPKSQMHHHNYDKPLEVEWLCRPCHMRLHQEERRSKLPPPPKYIPLPAVARQPMEGVIELRKCKAHGNPVRKGQRNCAECNRDAAARYRRSLQRATS